MQVTLWVRGIAHYILDDDERAAFFMKIINKHITLRPEKGNRKDEMAIAAMYLGNQIGHVSVETKGKAWGCFIGTGKKRLRAKVIDTDRVNNSLRVRVDIDYRKMVDVVFDQSFKLDDWDYDGPLLTPHERLFQLDEASDQLLDDLKEHREWDDEMEGCYNRLLKDHSLDHSQEMHERITAILTEMEKSKDRTVRERVHELRLSITHSHNDESWLEKWEFIRQTGISETFRHNVRLWHDPANEKRLTDMLPAPLRKAYREPADLLGYLTYQPLNRLQLLQLLSFAAAMALIEEWREEEKKNVQIFQKESNPTVNFY